MSRSRFSNFSQWSLRKKVRATRQGSLECVTNIINKFSRYVSKSRCKIATIDTLYSLLIYSLIVRIALRIRVYIRMVVLNIQNKGRSESFRDRDPPRFFQSFQPFNNRACSTISYHRSIDSTHKQSITRLQTSGQLVGADANAFRVCSSYILSS